MRLSLRLALVFSFFGLAIAAGFLTRHVRVVRREAYERSSNMAHETLSAVRALVAVEARAGRYDELGDNLAALVRQAGIAMVNVRDRRGRRVLCRVDDPRLLSRTPHPGVSIERVADGVYDVEADVSLGARGRGTVIVGYHTVGLEARLAELEVKAVQLGATAFLGIVLTAWLMGSWFGWRLERILPRLEALPKDPEKFRPLRGGEGTDEVGRLIGAFNRMGKVLKEETLRRREAEEEKRELSAMLVHDLKTPLTVVRSGVALLGEALLEGKEHPPGKPISTKRTIELLTMSTDRLQRMVEDVLQLSRLEEVPGLREVKDVDLAALSAAAAKDFELITGGRKQHLTADIPSGLLAVVKGDAFLLRRVVDNLMHNAVEYTPPGGAISIGVKVHGHKVRVEVSDGGPGIPPEARPEIFRKFFQKDFKRHVGNVGLGLALCLKVIQRHGGVIGVEDAEPHGARFFFEVPGAG